MHDWLARALLLLALPGLGACDGDPAADGAPELPAARVRILATGAGISGANGLHAGPDGLLYVASVMGSELVALDPDSGEVRRRLTAADGVVGPDDVAFGPDGSVYWTSILTGEVAGLRPSGEVVVAARLQPGVNPLTFSDDGRLFVAQCFFADGVYEIDPLGRAEPRLLTAELGPGCGLNGMDWGPDGRLYGPRWFHGEVVSLDADSGARRLEADGFEVPAAVKFDQQGRLHVLDTGAGRVLRLDGGEPQLVAELEPGLDNLAFDGAGRLFVSSFTDGYVQRIDADGRVVELSPGGMAHPGGVAVLQPQDGPARVMVADLHALRGFDPATGEAVYVERNVVGIGPLGNVLAVAADGDHLLLTAFLENAVRRWDPQAGRVVERFDDLRAPVSAIRYRELVAVAEHGSGRVLGLDGAARRTLAAGLPAPTGLATDGERLFVSDRVRGEIIEIARGGTALAPRVVTGGLAAPEGLAWSGDGLVVVEGESGRVLRVTEDGSVSLLAVIAPGTPPASDAQPPSLVFNGVAVLGRTLFVSGETSRVLYRVDLDAPAAPGADAAPAAVVE